MPIIEILRCIIEEHDHKAWNKLVIMYIVLIFVQHYQCSR